MMSCGHSSTPTGAVRDGCQHSCSCHIFEDTLDNPSTVVTGTHPPVAFEEVQLMRNVLAYTPVPLPLQHLQNPHRVTWFLQIYISHITVHRE